jgi:hypothetical protein
MHPELGLPEVRKLWQTEGLFSDHYLKARLQKNSWWPSDAEAEPIWRFCKELYEKRYLACAKNNEAFTRQELLDKILEKLGFAWTDNLGLPDQDADGKSTCALVIGRRAGSPSTCAFAVGTRAFASRPRA